MAAQSCAIIPSMARHTDSQAPADGPDLFSFAPKAAEQVAQPVAVAKLTVTQPQVILPDDLDKALSCLSLSDIERLRQAVERQYKQRGLVGAERRDGSPVAKPEPRSTEGTSQRRQQAAASKTGNLTTGTAPEAMTSASTWPGPTEGSWSMSPTISSAA